MKIEKWRITFVVVLCLSVYAMFLLGTMGQTEEAIRAFLRGTARTSLTLFLLAFSASSLQSIVRGKVTEWVIQNRRYFGISFALSHMIHLAAILMLAVMFPHPFLDRLGLVSLVGGGIAYVFIFAMLVTSFSAPAYALGRRRWKTLHTVGAYYLWIIFAQSYFPKALKDVFYIPFAIALLVVLVLRLVHYFLTKSSVVNRNHKVT